MVDELKKGTGQARELGKGRLLRGGGVTHQGGAVEPGRGLVVQSEDRQKRGSRPGEWSQNPDWAHRPREGTHSLARAPSPGEGAMNIAKAQKRVIRIPDGEEKKSTQGNNSKNSPSLAKDINLQI